MYNTDTMSSSKLVSVTSHLIVSEGVEPFPVVVDLGGDIFVLQYDSCHSALAPFCWGAAEERTTKTHAIHSKHLSFHQEL